MLEKKILLSETKPLKRKCNRGKLSKSDPQRNNSSKINKRQRSEAIGLILIGISAFWFSLLYYLTKSKVSNGISNLIVQFGIGIFILPILVGIMGIQRFLEKPFANFSWRVMGSIGTLVFGLGVLGLEGGKFGSGLLNFFSSRFGPIPSKILLSFLTLSSLIFALDILYKDLLIATIGAGRLLVRAGSFLWELFLVLLALLIEAAKNTGVFATGLGAFALSFFRSDEESSEDDPRLLPIISGGEPSSNPEISNIALQESLPKDPTSNPRHWRQTLQVQEQDPAPATDLALALASAQAPVSEKPKTLLSEKAQKNENDQSGSLQPALNVNYSSSSTSNVMVHIETISSIVSMPPQEPYPNFPAPTDSGTRCQSENDRANESEILSKPKSEILKQILEPVEKYSETLPVEHEVEDEIESEDELSPFPLDDNQIDKDLVKEPLKESFPANGPQHLALLPPIDLLKVPTSQDHSYESDLQTRSALLLKTLEDFGIKATISDVVEGPAVSRFEIKPAPGVKVARITSLVDDIALALSAQAIRIEAPIPGKPALGIEIPNSKPRPVFLFDLVSNDRFKSSETLLNLGLGVTISGRPVFADLADMPHLLIAGATGSGKSVCINTIIASILFQARPDQVKMVMIDPKMVELSTYNGIPHLISPVVTDPKKASAALLWAVEEMERRYETLASCGVRKISTYNDNLSQLQADIDPELTRMSTIVLIIDELADLMMTASAEVEGSICRLAQMARAVGIHLVIATQRPSVDVLTGIIKANLPSRIAFSVASHIDSRTILDMKGAERLLGKGDMLFVPKGRNKPLRLQGAFVSDRELQDLTEWVKSQGKAEYVDIAPLGKETSVDDEDSTANEDEDTKLLSSIENYLATQEKTSTSMLQRRFKIGYNRAARIMDILELKGFVSPLDGSNKRRVLGRRS